MVRYISASLGLFPRPIKFGMDVEIERFMLWVNLCRIQLVLYKSLGIFTAKSLADGRIIDFPFNSVFLELLMSGDTFSRKSSDGGKAFASQLRALKVILSFLY
jgi:hypothetical protein